MSTFFHPITLIAEDGRRETIDALVDTGSTFTSVPQAVLEAFGVRPVARVRMRLANGEPSDVEVDEIKAELAGLAARTIPCAFGSERSIPVIGAVTLEIFVLGVDPFGRKLVPVEGWQATR